MTPRFGYFVPEFPGQTHIFFWRELKALKELGVEPDLVSTRKPARAIISHSWAEEVMRRTTYLAPPNATTLSRAAREIVRHGPTAWARILRSVARAEGMDARRRARLLALAVAGAQLAALARERGWVHIHAHSCADAAHVAMFAHLLSNIPYSISLHGPLHDYGPNQREKWNHAALGIVITQRLFREVHEQIGGSLPQNVEIAPMGVELDRFVRQSPYVAWDRKGQARIFSCGRLNPCKGHADLIEAVARLRDGGIDATLTIAGEDEAGGTTYHRELDRIIRARKMQPWVKLLGAVSEEVVREELERAHIFSLASLQEPLGVAIMEAMALCAPVVVTGAGGVPELVTDGEDGLLVQPQDPGALATALRRVLEDPVLATRLGQAGRQKIEESFDSRRSAKVLARYVQGLN